MMKINKIWPLIFLHSLLVIACIDEYMPDLERYEHILVVDGMLTSEPGPHIVKLSLSSPLNQKDSNMVSGAILYIVDGDNNRIALKETAPGIYSTEPDDWAGKYGQKYKLEITTKDNIQYESEFQEMRSPESIDSIYGQIEFASTQDVESPEQAVYQFYINNYNIISDTAYFLWLLEETYEYDAQKQVLYIWDGNKINDVLNRDTLRTCWKTEIIPSIYTATNEGLTEPELISFPLNKVIDGGLKMNFRYSLLVTQFSLNKESFKYWTDMKNQDDTQAGLYASQPYQINGNMYNISNKNEPVLGNFTVASIARKRVMVRAQPEFEEYIGPLCDPNPDKLPYMLTPDKIVFIGENDEGYLGALSASCYDCRQAGGTLEKPVFWEQNNIPVLP